MTSDPLVCYVHINKNAGNSIIEALLNNYPGQFRQYLVSGRRSNGGPGAKTVDSPDEDVRQIVSEIVENQHRHDAIALNLPVGVHRRIGRPVRYVTMLREPVDRCVSYWYWAYRKRDTGNLWAALQAGLPDGVAGLPLQFRDDQVRFLSGTTNVETTDDDLALAKKAVEEHFAFVGTVERFAECQARLGEMLSWKRPATFHLNSGDRGDHRLLPPEAIDIFRAANTRDMELYQWLTRSYLPSVLGRT
ncbi:hypothetical protein [Micromonospora sp. NPDC049374]|uniref:hypothetical protein n=1 Tax=unclassified Micromonospora TaxID=2617518 RepID=UPI00343B0AA4